MILLTSFMYFSRVFISYYGTHQSARCTFLVHVLFIACDLMQIRLFNSVWAEMSCFLIILALVKEAEPILSWILHFIFAPQICPDNQVICITCLLYSLKTLHCFQWDLVISAWMKNIDWLTVDSSIIQASDVISSITPGNIVLE